MQLRCKHVGSVYREALVAKKKVEYVGENLGKFPREFRMRCAQGLQASSRDPLETAPKCQLNLDRNVSKSFSNPNEAFIFISAYFASRVNSCISFMETRQQVKPARNGTVGSKPVVQLGPVLPSDGFSGDGIERRAAVSRNLLQRDDARKKW